VQFESDFDAEYTIKFQDHEIKGKKVGVLPYQQPGENKNSQEQQFKPEMDFAAQSI
jgi:hypothetical protein